MNNRERDIIAYHYKKYCENRANGDPVGGYEDVRQLFIDLADDDSKLASQYEEIENEVFNNEKYD